MTRKNIKERAAKYLKYVEWSDEDKCFIGRCPEAFMGAVHGSDETKAYEELCETVEEWIELLDKEGARLPEPISNKSFSGKFVVRVDPALHRRLAAKAMASGDSLNAYCVKTLSKG